MKKIHNIEELKDFYNKNHRLPSQCNKKEGGLYQWMIRKINKGNKEVIEFTKGKRKNIHSNYSLSDLIAFYNKNQKLPKSNKKGEMSLYDWMKDEIKKSNKEIIEFVKGKENRHFYSLSELITFYNNNHRLPNQCNKEETSFYLWMGKEIRNGNKEVIEFVKGKRKSYYSLSDLIDFYNKNHRLPKCHKKGEKNFYGWMWRKINEGNKELKAFTYLVKNQDNENIRKLLPIYIKQHKE